MVAVPAPAAEVRPRVRHLAWAWLLPRALYGAAAGLLGAYIAFAWPFTVDDAFITYRYSENLASGYGPTYNPGALPHAEGYTSFLWMVVMALPHLFGWDAVVVSKLLGIAATLGTLAITARFAYDLTSSLEPHARQVCAAFVVLLLAAYYPTAVHAVAGMDTALFALLLTTFLYLLTFYVASPSSSRAAGLAITALALGLTRPEGNLVAAVSLVGAALVVPREQKRALLTSVLLGYVAPGALYFAWRFTYYGLPLPLPAYMKIGAMPLFAGRYGLLGFAGELATHIGVLLIFGLVRFNKALRPGLVSVVLLLVFYVFPAPIMGHAWRYFFPIAPFLFVIATIGFANLSGWLLQAREHLPSARSALAALGLFVVLGLVSDARDRIGGLRDYGEMWSSKVIPLGKQLGTLTPLLDRNTGGGAVNRAPTIALLDAGAIPYYSKWHAIDTFSLNDPHIAQAGWVDPAYVLSRQPDILAVISVDRDKFVPFMDSEARLYEAALAQGMVTAGTLTVESQPSTYIYWIMVPRGSPIRDQLARAVDELNQNSAGVPNR